MSRKSKRKNGSGKVPASNWGASASQASERSGAANLRLPEFEGHSVGLNDRWTVLGVCLFLAAITFAVFGQTLHHGFVSYDDG